MQERSFFARPSSHSIGAQLLLRIATISLHSEASALSTIAGARNPSWPHSRTLCLIFIHLPSPHSIAVLQMVFERLLARFRSQRELRPRQRTDVSVIDEEAQCSAYASCSQLGGDDRLPKRNRVRLPIERHSIAEERTRCDDADDEAADQLSSLMLMSTSCGRLGVT